MCKWDRCHNSYQVPKYRKRFECSWSGYIVDTYRIGTLEFRFATGCTPLLFRIPVRSGKIICKRGRQRNRLCETNRDTSFCLHLPYVFSAFPFHPRRANRSNRRALSVCRSVYRIRMYKERKNRELVGGSMRNGRPSLSLRQASRSSHGESRWMAGITLSATRLNRKLKNGRAAMKESRSCSGCYRRRSFPFVLLAISRLA